MAKKNKSASNKMLRKIQKAGGRTNRKTREVASKLVKSDNLKPRKSN